MTQLFSRWPFYQLSIEMKSPSQTSSNPLSTLVPEITETLEACGLEQNEYQLYDAVDVEALEQLINSSSGNVTVQFTVGGVRLVVTSESVDVLTDDDELGSTGQ